MFEAFALAWPGLEEHEGGTNEGTNEGVSGTNETQDKDAAMLLQDLLAVRGRHASGGNTKNEKRRVIRKGGIAFRTAKLLERIIEEVNLVHQLSEYPVTLRHVLKEIEEGASILSESKTTVETEILAQAALDITASAGRASNGSVIGLLASPNVKGKFKTSRVAELAGVSKSMVKKNRKVAECSIRCQCDEEKKKQCPWKTGTFVGQSKGRSLQYAS